MFQSPGPDGCAKLAPNAAVWGSRTSWARVGSWVGGAETNTPAARDRPTAGADLEDETSGSALPLKVA